MVNEVRLIDANALIAEYDRVHIGPPGGARKLMEDAPTVDAVEVVHGRWVSLTECANAGVYCSVCHKKVYKEDYAWCNRKNKLRSNYCPNCGAKMDGDGDGTAQV